MSDTDFAGTGIDPAFEEMMKREAEVQEAEEQIGRPELPRGDYHIGYLASAKFREVFDDKIPAVQVGFTVTEGVKGAVDRTYYDDLFLGWGEMSRVEPKNPKSELRPATDEEIAERRDAVIAKLKRFQRVFGLGSFLPKSATAEGVQDWLGHLVEAKTTGPKVIFTGFSVKGYSRISFASLRRPDDAGKDPKTKEPNGKTALETAREVISKTEGGYTESGGSSTVY